MSKIHFRDPARNLRAFVKLLGDFGPSKPVCNGFGLLRSEPKECPPKSPK